MKLLFRYIIDHHDHHHHGSTIVSETLRKMSCGEADPALHIFPVFCSNKSVN